MARQMAAVMVAAALMAATGCYESTDVTLHEPGEYKGKVDPLQAKLAQGDLRQQLDSRFKAVQTDR